MLVARSIGDPDLEQIRSEFSQEVPRNPYEDFFLLANPFPDLGQFCGLCVNQESVKAEFTRVLRELYGGSQSRVMTILGSTGAGKTNLLRFLEGTLKGWREPGPERRAITDLFTVFVEQPQGSYLEMHRQIVGQLGEVFFSEFFTRVRRGEVDLGELSEALGDVNPELLQALRYIAGAESGQLPLGEPRSYRLLGDWLQGGRVGVAERRRLGSVSAEVGRSGTVAIRFLSDFVRVLLEAKLLRGLVIFVDEFEEVFSGVSAAKQAQYAQDLRNLIDSHPKGVVFVIGTAPLGEQLQSVSPPLQRRLGRGVEVEPIADEKTALEYAQAYVGWGRERFVEERQVPVCVPEECEERDQPYYPLCEESVKGVFRDLQGELGSQEVVPGDFLPGLNFLLYKRVYGEGRCER